MGVTGTLLKSTLVVVVLAVLVAKLAPELLFRVPNVGFILYAISGGQVPPYMTHECWEKQNDFLRAGDIVVSAGAKMGTTWNLNIQHQLRMKGSGQFDDLLLETPWLELVQYPGQTWEDRLGFYNTVQSKYANSYGVWKSHYRPRVLRKDVKYVVALRNPLDVMSSIRPFFSDHTPEFRKMWGGFPPLFSSDADFDPWWFEDAGDGVQSGLDLFYTTFIQSWWPHRNDPNVFFVHYNDLKSDFDGTLDKLISFTDTTLSAEELARVKEFTSYAWMKKEANKFSATLILQPAVDNGFLEAGDGFLKHGVLIRKGQTGSGKKEFSKEQQDRLWAAVEAGLPDRAMHQYALNGGAVPS